MKFGFFSIKLSTRHYGIDRAPGECQSQKQKNYAMIVHNLKVTFRHAIKNKVHTAINVVGLVVAFCSFQLIYLFVAHELSYDAQHSNNVYRITTNALRPSGDIHWVNTPPALAPALRAQYAHKVTRLRYAKDERFSYNGQQFYEKKAFYADSSFLEVFKYPMAQGDPATALDAPNSIVLTEESAQKYFGSRNPIGETILLRNEIPLTVTGLLEPLRSNEHLDFEMLISFSTYEVPEGYLSDLTSWTWVGFHTYVLVNDNTDIDQLQREIDIMYEERDTQNLAVLQPVQAIYFGSNAMTDAENSPIRSGNRNTTYWLIVVCLLIIAIASFNLMSSTFGLSIKRLREVGVRKVLGGNKASLISGILLHSTMVSMLSFVLGSIVLVAVFPWVKSTLNWDIALKFSTLLAASGAVFIISFLIGLLSGVYPAVALAQYNIVKALKGQSKLGKGQFVQSTLITVQFAVSVGLILATVVIIKQIDYMRTKSLGFDKDQVLILKVPRDAMDQYYSPLRNALVENPNIQSVAQATRLMGESLGVNMMVPRGGTPDDDGVRTSQILVDYDFIETMDIELLEGRFFSRDFAADSTRSIVINETAAALLGFENPVGEQVQFLSQGYREIIGVIKDFHFSSMHSEIGPLALVFTFINPGNILVRVSDIDRGVDFIETAWARVVPDIPLDLVFYDDRLNRLYDKETNLSHLISAFSTVAILLTIMGLYGIIVLLINNRMKEVGIRKVLGSSVPSLIILLAKKYFFLAFASLAIGLPITYGIINRWLDNFSYQTTVPWWIFAGSALSLILLVAVTILYKIVNVSKMNPVNVLRTD